ncbi:MAG: DUF1573 domain-containing protein [Bacteroidales bacterium]|jgi:hypothetical protein|nr:DUF1573 domain-containing protein [Bacteroidales bacterium]
MKQTIGLLLFVIAGIMCACNSAQNQSETAQQTALSDSLPLTSIVFAHTNFNFGSIADGEVVEHVYTFTNTGEHDLVLRDVKPSCGCTTPDFTRVPVKPGEQGKITVKFDSKGKPGNQIKTVNVTANTDPETTVLRFTAQVRENK